MTQSKGSSQWFILWQVADFKEDFFGFHHHDRTVSSSIETVNLRLSCHMLFMRAFTNSVLFLQKRCFSSIVCYILVKKGRKKGKIPELLCENLMDNERHQFSYNSGSQPLNLFLLTHFNHKLWYCFYIHKGQINGFFFFKKKSQNYLVTQKKLATQMVENHWVTTNMLSVHNTKQKKLSYKWKFTSQIN